MSEKIEAFWENATAKDVERVMAGETVEARFRDEDREAWKDGEFLGGCKAYRTRRIRFIDLDGISWEQRQVYREPSWYADKPDPGPGFRLLGKFPDEELKPGDEAWDKRDDKQWTESDNAKLGTPQSEGMWYRRRIEPVEPKFSVGQTVRVIGPKERTPTHWDTKMDKHIGLIHTIVSVQSYPKHPSGATNFYSVNGISNWAFREDYLEPVEPEPKHYVLRVGDSVETPRGHLINVVSSNAEQRIYSLDAGDKLKLPNGQTITITEKGFEVTQ
jgi:hypothetical protein